MTLITGNKAWQVIIWGELPPGMNEAQAIQFVTASLNLNVAITGLLKEVKVSIIDLPVGPDGGRLRA